MIVFIETSDQDAFGQLKKKFHSLKDKLNVDCVQCREYTPSMKLRSLNYSYIIYINDVEKFEKIFKRCTGTGDLFGNIKQMLHTQGDPSSILYDTSLSSSIHSIDIVLMKKKILISSSWWSHPICDYILIWLRYTQWFVSFFSEWLPFLFKNINQENHTNKVATFATSQSLKNTFQKKKKEYLTIVDTENPIVYDIMKKNTIKTIQNLLWKNQSWLGRIIALAWFIKTIFLTKSLIKILIWGNWFQLVFFIIINYSVLIFLDAFFFWNTIKGNWIFKSELQCRFAVIKKYVYNPLFRIIITEFITCTPMFWIFVIRSLFMGLYEKVDSMIRSVLPNKRLKNAINK